MPHGNVRSGSAGAFFLYNSDYDLQKLLQRGKARYATKLVHREGDTMAVALHFLEGFPNRFGLRNKIGRSKITGYTILGEKLSLA